MANSMTWHIDANNIALVLAAKEKQVQNGLAAIGEKAATHAQRGAPVDTGRLRNSISYATQKKHGGQNGNSGAKADAKDYAMRGTPEKSAVYIGTNVEYAPQQEYHDMAHKTGGAHFIKNAATSHGEEYKAIMSAALKS